MQRSNLTVEDILLEISSYNLQSPVTIKLGLKDRSIIDSLAKNVVLQNPLTVKQGDLAIRILSRYKNQIMSTLNLDITPLLNKPVYKYKLRNLNNLREIKIVNNKIHVSFNYDEKLINEISRYKISNKTYSSFIIWNSADKFWEFPLIEKNVLFLGNTFLKQEFSVDERFMNLYEKCKSMYDNQTHYIPYISYDQKPLIKNFHISIPENIKNNLLETIFFIKKLGIKSYDQSFYTKCQELKLDNYIDLLYNDKKFVTDIDMLANITRYNKVLFVLSQGAELKSIKFVKKLIDLSGRNIKSVSTLVRLKSNYEQGKVFNQYIKDNELNSSLGENSKIVIISDKIPKPLIPHLNFDFIITLSTTIISTYLKSYMSTHPGIISYNVYSEDLF